MARRGGGNGEGSTDLGGVEPPGRRRGALPGWLAVIFGFALGTAFFLVLAGLWSLADEEVAQQVWDRRLGLFLALGPIFGAVVGATFGLAVSAPVAARADRRAELAEHGARHDAEDAARARGELSAAVERSRADILRLAAEASRSNPEIVVSDATFEGEDTARGSLAMALAHPGPVNVIEAADAGSSPVISLAELAAIVEEAQGADSLHGE